MPGNKIHTLQTLTQQTTHARPAEQANPITQPAAQTNALGLAIAGTTAVTYVQTLAQQNHINTDIVVEDLTEEAVNTVIAGNTEVNIDTTIVVQNGQEWANETIDNLNPGNVQNAQQVIAQARRGMVSTLPGNASASQDDESITSNAGKKKCNCTVQKVACAVFAVFLMIFAISIYHSTAKLDFVVRKPGAEKKDDDPEAPPDKQIVDMVNESAACWGIDVAQPFTVEDVKPLLKEIQEWYHMSEKEFWGKSKARDVRAEERMSADSILYQILFLSGLSPLAFMMISHKPEWTWVFPKDGALLSTVLATIYKEQGVNAMYDYIGQYKYYKKTLPRSVAMDVVIAALTHILPKKK